MGAQACHRGRAFGPMARRSFAMAMLAVQRVGIARGARTRQQLFRRRARAVGASALRFGAPSGRYDSPAASPARDDRGRERRTNADASSVDAARISPDGILVLRRKRPEQAHGSVRNRASSASAATTARHQLASPPRTQPAADRSSLRYRRAAPRQADSRRSATCRSLR